MGLLQESLTESYEVEAGTTESSSKDKQGFPRWATQAVLF